MFDELEQGPDPSKIRNPLSRRPARPARADQALRSYQEGQAFSIRRPSESEAMVVKSELIAAVYWLNKWGGYDVRVRPYITKHWTDERGSERTVDKDHPAPSYPVEFYWKTNFRVADPQTRGFRSMSAEDHEAALRASARQRGVTIQLDNDH